MVRNILEAAFATPARGEHCQFHHRGHFCPLAKVLRETACAAEMRNRYRVIACAGYIPCATSGTYPGKTLLVHMLGEDTLKAFNIHKPLSLVLI